MLKKNKNYFSIAILLGFFFRIISFYFFRDHNLDNEWEILFKNYINFKIIGINVFNGKEIIQSIASTNNQVLPSIFMPPFYLFVLIFFNFIFSEKYLVIAVLFFQILLSIISSCFLFRLLSKYFSEKISFIGLIIFLYFPLNIYSTTQISSATLQIFCIILFFYFFDNFLKKKKNKNLILFSVTSAILILLRGEFILILFFTYLFILLKTYNFKLVFISFFLVLFIISPYLARNYLNFEEIIITKSFGYNLWKGNNKLANSEGSEDLYDDNMIRELSQIKPDKYYEIKKDNILKKYAINNIKSEPKHYFKLFLKKILAFTIYDRDSTYPNYYNPFHIIPKLIIGIFSLIGVFLVDQKNKTLLYFNLCFILNVLIFSTFFILPRYQLGILPLQIILSCKVLQKFIKS